MGLILQPSREPLPLLGNNQPSGGYVSMAHDWNSAAFGNKQPMSVFGTNLPGPQQAGPAVPVVKPVGLGDMRPRARMTTGSGGGGVVDTAPTGFGSQYDNNVSIYGADAAMDWQNKGMMGKTFTTPGGGLNFDNISSVLSGVGAIGSLWGGIQANKIAKDSLNFQKESYATNLNNQISSYNTALEDRATSRANFVGTAAAHDNAQAYITKHKLGE